MLRHARRLSFVLALAVGLPAFALERSAAAAARPPAVQGKKKPRPTRPAKPAKKPKAPKKPKKDDPGFPM